MRAVYFLDSPSAMPNYCSASISFNHCFPDDVYLTEACLK